MKNRVKNQMRVARNNGLSPLEVLQMREIARKEAEKMENEATEKAFLYMLAIPLNVLVADYWPKTAKRRAPKLIDDVISLYQAVEAGVVTKEQLVEVLQEYGQIDFRARWLKAKGE